MLILAFDTATDVATSALVADGDVLGERVSAPRCLLQDLDELLRAARVEPPALDALVVGTGPGSFTSTRIGLAIARGLAIALEIPVAGISTLDALGSGTDNGYPVIDARRGEVFVRGPRAVHPDDLELEPGAVCIGSGAVRYRPAFEREGALVPPDDDPVHLPSARLHASLAHAFGPADDLLPIYGRAPDAQVRSAA